MMNKLTPEQEKKFDGLDVWTFVNDTVVLDFAMIKQWAADEIARAVEEERKRVVEFISHDVFTSEEQRVEGVKMYLEHFAE